MLKIGILKEGKTPIDHRVAITPDHAKIITETYPEVSVVCHPSEIRCYKDQDYTVSGTELTTDLNECDILIGVKEVLIDELIPKKTYFFFSHTIKKQPYNRDLLRAILKKNIKLIDYETLTNLDGARIIAFGRWAGIVGAYNAFWTYGQRYNTYHIKRAHECYDLNELLTEVKKIKLPSIKIAITGGGRVAKGAIEILNAIGVKKVSPEDFITQKTNEVIYSQLKDIDYNVHKENEKFDLNEYFTKPENFRSTFLPYTQEADMLIACAFWHPKAPVLFTKEQMQKPEFKIRVIADITCDIEGSIPSTLRATTIDKPIYDYDPKTHQEFKAFSNEEFITVMSVDNLPCELPRDASTNFGQMMLDNVLPNLVGEDKNNIIDRATITQNGQLTARYKYLQDYVDGKDV